MSQMLADSNTCNEVLISAHQPSVIVISWLLLTSCIGGVASAVGVFWVHIVITPCRDYIMLRSHHVEITSCYLKSL